MKSRSKFYLTPDDILDNETVQMRQPKKSPSGDSKLGQSSKFWSIQEQGLLKCMYCVCVCYFSPSFFLPIDPQTDVSRPTSVQLNKKEHVGIYLTGIILSLIVLLPVITSWILIILYSPQNPFIWATVSNHTVAIKVYQSIQ